MKATSFPTSRSGNPPPLPSHSPRSATNLAYTFPSRSDRLAVPHPGARPAVESSDRMTNFNTLVSHAAKLSQATLSPPNSDAGAPMIVAPISHGGALPGRVHAGTAPVDRSKTAPAPLVAFLNRQNAQEVNATPPLDLTSPSSVWRAKRNMGWEQAATESEESRPNKRYHHQAESQRSGQLSGIQPSAASRLSSTPVVRSNVSSMSVHERHGSPREMRHSVSLVRTASEWRNDLKSGDRNKTLERIQKGLRYQVFKSERSSEINYEALLTIISAMQEELLHIHSHSKDTYFDQAIALSDQINNIR